jgi:hypothetical protein
MSEREQLTFESKIDGKEVVLKVQTESLKIQQKADQQYHIAYVQAIKEGIPPRSTLEKMLREHEMRTTEDDVMLDTLRIQVAALEIQLEQSKTQQEGVVIATQLAELRAQLIDIQRNRNEVLNNSAEFVAETIRRDAYLSYATVYADTDKLVFENYEEFIQRGEEQVVTDLRQKVTITMLDEFNSYLDTLPEAQFAGVEEKVVTATKTKKKAKKKTSKKAAKRKAERRKKSTNSR